MSDVQRLTCVADISRLHGRERPDAIAIDFKDGTLTAEELRPRRRAAPAG